MNSGCALFSQMIDHLSLHDFRKCVARYDGNHRVRTFSCWDQFLCMAFAQFTFRESLRDIVSCLRSAGSGLYHLGIRGNVSRSTLADANESRDWRIFADFAQTLIATARGLYLDQDLGIALSQKVYALDSTIIDLCMSLFPWALYKPRLRAIKLHTQLDLRGNIPTFLHISPAKTHDVNFLDQLQIEPGAFYVIDRGYLDFARLYRFTTQAAFFITRPRSNFRFKRIASAAVDQSSGVRCDQTISLVWYYPRKGYPQPLRRVGFYDLEQRRRITFITNNFTLPARTIAELYRLRWQVELFFKWIKQHLRIKRFYGTSPNAVKIQIWTAMAAYALIAILKKRLGLQHSLYTILQILSTTLFEKTPAQLVFQRYDDEISNSPTSNQLELFEI